MTRLAIRLFAAFYAPPAEEAAITPAASGTRVRWRDPQCL